MTRIHTIHGLSCTYPENWQLSEDRENDRLASFTLESPNTAFMSVYLSRDSGQSQQMIDEMTELLRAEYEDIESSELEGESLGLGDLAEDLTAVDLNFYYLDLLVTARLVAFSQETRTVLVQCQAEDREFDAIEMVFRAMLVSMTEPKKKKASPGPG